MDEPRFLTAHELDECQSELDMGSAHWDKLEEKDVLQRLVSTARLGLERAGSQRGCDPTPSTVAAAGSRGAEGLGVQSLVREFHEAFGIAVADEPTRPTPQLHYLRTRLIEEEAREVAVALARAAIKGPGMGYMEAVAKELADLAYVTFGAAVSLGIDLDAAIREVHRSNMSKLDEDGQPVRRNDGKVLKGPNYVPPDPERLLSCPS